MIKDEHDKTIRYKSRCCSKGYEAVPGKDFKESFSPVASDTLIRIGFCLYLTYDDYEAEMIDITAAFFGGNYQSPNFYRLARRDAGSRICFEKGS